MKIDITSKYNGKNLGGRFEVVDRRKVLACVNGKILCAMVVRVYKSRSGDGASPIYASVWINKPATGYNYVVPYTSGNGVAKGFGGAAIIAALHSAGVVIDDDIPQHADNATLETIALRLFPDASDIVTV